MDDSIRYGEERNLQSYMLHGDVIIGMSTYNDLDHELAPVAGLSAGDMPEIPQPREHWLAKQEVRAWMADADQERADRHTQELGEVASRPDAVVRREVLRALLLDSLVPTGVDAQVSEGVVTLTGIVSSEQERKDATHLAGCVPGVIGVLDDLAYRPSRNDDDKATRDAVLVALAGTSIADVADLAVCNSGCGTVILSGAVQSRSDHDLAIATALSVAGVEVVEDCIQVES
jgi:osmotically-inducible protein OsmY